MLYRILVQITSVSDPKYCSFWAKVLQYTGLILQYFGTEYCVTLTKSTCTTKKKMKESGNFSLICYDSDAVDAFCRQTSKKERGWCDIEKCLTSLFPF